MADDDYLWDPAATPDPDIQRLEALLRPAAHAPTPMRDEIRIERARPSRIHRWPAVAAAMLLVGAGWYAVQRARITPWSVIATSGSPTLRTASGALTERRLDAGGVLETDARSSARLTVGRIGRATIGPGSRVRLLSTGALESLLFLERGTMHARIDAPPRYFLVQTPSALAVDLGCMYTLTVDARGDGVLTVEEGEVELQQGEVKVAVLAGNSAALHKDGAPGLPWPAGADSGLRRAIGSYDAHPDSAALDAVLAHADARSTITLWHLLGRAAPAERARVFDRLAALAPPPATVTRARVLRGESGALQRWRTALQPGWITEPPPWRRMWLSLAR